jgi:hypothetical protein
MASDPAHRKSFLMRRRLRTQKFREIQSGINGSLVARNAD